MSKEKIARLTKYAEDIKNKIQVGPTPKHKDHPEAYNQFLQRELSTVNKKIEEMKMLVK